jgi:hypothetical protein
VPDLEAADPFKLMVDGQVKKTKRRLEEAKDAITIADKRGSFASYQSAKGSSEASLDIPSMRLKLRLKKFKGTGVADLEVK